MGDTYQNRVETRFGSAIVKTGEQTAQSSEAFQLVREESDKEPTLEIEMKPPYSPIRIDRTYDGDGGNEKVDVAILAPEIIKVTPRRVYINMGFHWGELRQDSIDEKLSDRDQNGYGRVRFELDQVEGGLALTTTVSQTFDGDSEGKSEFRKYMNRPDVRQKIGPANIVWRRNTEFSGLVDAVTKLASQMPISSSDRSHWIQIAKDERTRACTQLFEEHLHLQGNVLEAILAMVVEHAPTGDEAKQFAERALESVSSLEFQRETRVVLQGLRSKAKSRGREGRPGSKSMSSRGPQLGKKKQRNGAQGSRKPGSSSRSGQSQRPRPTGSKSGYDRRDPAKGADSSAVKKPRLR